jgi:hypothetical protein
MKAKVFEGKDAAILEAAMTPFLRDVPNVQFITQSESAQGLPTSNEPTRIITVTVFYG